MFWVDFCERDESRPVPRSSPPQKPASSNELDPPGSVHLESLTTFDLFFFFFFFFWYHLRNTPRETHREREAKWMAGEEGHGKKRPAEADPDGAQPLTKRFGHLRIGRQLKLKLKVVKVVKLTYW